MGMLEVAALATTAAGVLPGVAINATFRRTRSAANAGSSPFLPESQRYSMATFGPSTKPASLSPLRKADVWRSHPASLSAEIRSPASLAAAHAPRAAMPPLRR
jgi:hypothetical protein